MRCYIFRGNNLKRTSALFSVQPSKLEILAPGGFPLRRYDQI